MYRVIGSNINEKSDPIFGMSNVLGKLVKQPYRLPFSFFFSVGDGVTHGPRVKPSFNPAKLSRSQAGTLKLCDDWEYVPGKEDSHVNSKDITEMKQFFKDHIVLFCAVWDQILQEGILHAYFSGSVSFDEVVQDFDFYNDYKRELDEIHDLKSLEDFCRKNNLVNLYGN